MIDGATSPLWQRVISTVSQRSKPDKTHFCLSPSPEGVSEEIKGVMLVTQHKRVKRVMSRTAHVDS